MEKRTIAIGDIHGCCKTFLRLLTKLDLKRSDTLYLLGDYVDRGPDSKGVISTILSLRREGYDLRPLKGNHEQMLLESNDVEDFRSLWLDNGGIQTLMSYHVRHALEIPGEHLRFLESLPLYEITDTHVLVHAALDLTLDDPFGEEGANAMLWGRSTRGDWSKLGGRTLVTGHTPVDFEHLIGSLRTQHIELDNGCVFGAAEFHLGRLVAVVLETGELFQQKYAA